MHESRLRLRRLVDDRYPSTAEQQSVLLELPYADAKNGLNRWCRS